MWALEVWPCERLRVARPTGQKLLPRCWRARVLEGRTGGRCWDYADEEHEKATWGPCAAEPSPGRAPCRMPRAPRLHPAAEAGLGQGRGRRPGIPRRRLASGAGSPGAAGRRVWVAGFPFRVGGKGSRAWCPPCGSALCHHPTQPSLHLPLSPSTATLTSSAAPCGLSSSAKCEGSQPEGGGHRQRPGSSSPSGPPPRARDSGAQCPRQGVPWGLPTCNCSSPPCRPSLPGWGGPRTRFCLVAPS